MVRIIGLDPGSRHTGYGVIEKHGSALLPLAYGRISCQQRLTLPQRITKLTADLEQIIDRWEPERAALETPFHGFNTRSLIVLAQARGALLAVLGKRQLDIREFSPAEVKSAVAGQGRADKEQVAKMIGLILSLRGKRLSRDATDALAVAVCCAQMHVYDRLTDPPNKL
ncbi:MAG: crossover junction endodeoxyribonuclease RuvC [Acidobacteriota bacterium]|nr:crossover junction endodeoxyribonuclease RuvC [Acidobacteriota bacterium]